MSWSGPFKSALRGAGAPYRPMMILETITPPTEIGHGGWRLTTHDGLGGQPLIGRGMSRIIGSEVTPRSWSSSSGAWSVPITDPAPFVGRLWRGQLVRLRIGFSGMAVDQFEPVALGQVWGLRGRPGAWSLEMRSIFSALQSRITATAGEYSLFNDVGTETTLAADYAAGAGTVTVTSSAGFGRQDDGTGTLKGALVITTAGGDTFVLSWTGLAGNVFTVGATAEVGTTALDASTGAVVTAVAYIDDHPIDLVRRVLTSTGTALAGGAYDTLPEQWGYGLSDYLIDHDDMGRWIPYTRPSLGSDDWEYLVQDEQDNGLSWMQSRLALGGFFMAVRQGRITCRACLAPTADAPHSEPLNDSEIVSVDSVDYWAGSYGVEYRRHKVITSAGSTITAEEVTSLPAFDRYDTDVTPFVFGNESAHRTHLAARLSPWVLRTPTAISVTCGGLWRAQHTAGDVIPLTTGLVTGRIGALAGNRAMVVRVAPDFYAGNTQLSLLVLPERADEFA